MGMLHMSNADRVPTVDEVVADVSSLITPPDVWLRINEVVNDPTSSSAEVAEVVSRDPSLAAALLRVVNSAFYNLPARVETISRAVTILGVRELFNVATMVTAAKVFQRLPSRVVRPDTFWRHGVCAGVIARRLARHCRVLHPERLYIAGLLHDIGSLVIYSRFPEQATEILLAAGGDEALVPSLERDILGFDHGELGGELARIWRLSETHQAAIRHHHQPDAEEKARLEVAITHVADALANRTAVGLFVEDVPPAHEGPDEEALRLLALPEERISGLCDGLEKEVVRAIASMLPNPRSRRE